jgi:acyl-CoA-binding protein
LSKRPDQATLLKLYALFKQAGTGDATGERPGFTDPVGRAKFDAWEKMRGIAPEQAKADYIALVRSLL